MVVAVSDPPQVFDHHTDEVQAAPGNRPVTPDSVGDILPSLQNDGQKVPGIVYPSPPGSAKPWTVAAGHRRLLCCRILGIPFRAIRLPGAISARDLAALRLTENVIRKAMTPREIATDLKLWMDEGKATQSEAAAHFGFSEPKVSKLLALLDLPATVQALIDAGRLGQDVGRIIASVPAERQEELAVWALNEPHEPRKRDAVERQAATMKSGRKQKQPKNRTHELAGARVTWPSDWTEGKFADWLKSLLASIRRNGDFPQTA